jgi:hypothetical protein
MLAEIKLVRKAVRGKNQQDEYYFHACLNADDIATLGAAVVNAIPVVAPAVALFSSTILNEGYVAAPTLDTLDVVPAGVLGSVMLCLV